MLDLDQYDLSLIRLLQQEGRATNQRLSEVVKLSAAPCWRRARRLEEEGVIKGYVALVDRETLGFNVLAYIHVSLSDHHIDTVGAFDNFVHGSPEVMECYSVSGEYDYLLRVVAKDVRALELFLMEGLLRESSVDSANTSFVLRQKKYTTQVPV